MNRRSDSVTFAVALVLALAACGDAVSSEGSASSSDDTVNSSSGSGGDAGGGGAGGANAGGSNAGGGNVGGNAGAGGGAATCVERNAPDEIAARDGFVEVCAPLDHPRAVCGDGSPYRFSYRPAEGESAGLLVYFRGGGNCTDYISCWGTDGLGGAGRTVSTLENDRPSPEVLPALGRTYGFFDRVDPTALFADFDIVYASYCTGDAGLKSTEEVFERPAEADPDAPATKTTYFRGIDNRRAVLDVASTLFPSPKRLAIVGSSAGSYAAMGAVPEAVVAFSTVADVSYYGEGGIGVGRPEYDDLVGETLAAHDGIDGRPLVRFVQFSFDVDATQSDYAPLPYSTDPLAFRDEVLALVAAREASYPGHYRSLVWPGTCHTLGNNPALYQAFEKVGSKWAPVVPPVRPNPVLVQGGVSLVDAIGALVRGGGAMPFESVVPDAPGSTCALPGG
jgi:hypothetical protein